jgi:3-hydroxy-3-methylglutaryl CoA synthase
MAKAWGRASIGGERSIANNDEDSATMAVEAVFDCLQGDSRSDLGGLFFASTTAPYREKEISSLIATTVDLPAEILTADFANGLRAGVAALRSGLDAVASGSAKNLLVAAADCRLAYPQSESEQAFGDGAAALAIGSSKVIATLEGHYSISNEMMDVWRKEDDTFVQSWENRWVLGEGYSALMEQALSGLMKKRDLNPKGITRAAFPAPDVRTHRRLAQVLGLDPKSQVVDPLLAQVGDCGAAHPFMLLVSALESAKAGDTILLGAYGNGAEAFLFKVTEEISKLKSRRGVQGWLQSKLSLPTYEKYLSYRGVLKTQPGDPFRLLPSATAYWRDVSTILRFHGSKCRSCGTLAFPIQRVCYNCRTKDSFEEVRLSDKKGKVFTFSLDNLAGRSDDPVIVQSIVESEVDRARVYCLMTDFQPKEVRVGMDVEFTFRRIYEGAGFQNYFWKCRPVR